MLTRNNFTIATVQSPDSASLANRQTHMQIDYALGLALLDSEQRVAVPQIFVLTNP
jgi:hypothetical protein